jgi:hypothetical protein
MVDLINSQLTIAGSEDYGKDLYDVERLIHNFNIFLENLNQAGCLSHKMVNFQKDVA